MSCDTFHYNHGEQIVFKVGQSFKDVYVVTDALRDYAIQEEYELVRNKSNFQRLTMTCV